MYKIKQSYENEIVINKSRFIGVIIPIDDDSKVKDILKDLNKKYPKATHYCYAYVINKKEKSNDDGEPSGTAGRPILEVIKNYELQDVLVVVIRYFGGIKLGAGGLVRAYVNASKEVIDKSEQFLVVNHNLYSLEMDYSLYDPMNYYLQKQDGKIVDTSFDETIRIDYLASSINIEEINEISKGNVKIVSKGQKEVYIKRGS
jgi:uncharacterized YigZ family protein